MVPVRFGSYNLLSLFASDTFWHGLAMVTFDLDGRRIRHANSRCCCRTLVPSRLASSSTCRNDRWTFGYGTISCRYGSA